MAHDGFDYDVIVIGFGFGRGVAATRAVEKGYKTAVLEAGKRWPDRAGDAADVDRPEGAPAKYRPDVTDVSDVGGAFELQTVAQRVAH